MKCQYEYLRKVPNILKKALNLAVLYGFVLSAALALAPAFGTGLAYRVCAVFVLILLSCWADLLTSYFGEE